MQSEFTPELHTLISKLTAGHLQILHHAGDLLITMVKESVILYKKEFRKIKKLKFFVSPIDLKVMKTLLTARLPVTMSSMQTWFYIM